MLSGDSKRVVVIKDIPSNIIEEAIFILKPEFLGKSGTGSKRALAKVSKSKDEFMIKEAELIINNYIRDAEAFRTGGKKKTNNWRPGTKKASPLNLTINLALAGSILFLVLMISKLF
ncbi:MAG TPA: hypothetical protein VHT34_12435 [Clostridia bacterium]|nr:hypothetical protein [Clostridia bacterium]